MCPSFRLQGIAGWPLSTAFPAKAGTHFAAPEAPIGGSRLSPGMRQGVRGRRCFPITILGATMLAATLGAAPALAQKSGGILRMPEGTSPASMSIHEESTIATLGPMMGVFNNLVMFDQHVKQNTLDSIVPDLALSWAWSEDAKELTFKLQIGRAHV